MITDSLIWNDYKDLDIDGKWVMVMRHSPERENPHSAYAPHSDLLNKMIEARDKGAAGIFLITKIINEVYKFYFDKIYGYFRSRNWSGY